MRAADAAVGADAVDRVELGPRPDRHVVDRLVGERTGRAGGHALAAGDAGRRAHRVVEVEGDAGRVALAAAADDVVALQVVAGAHAAVAEDAGVVVDGDHRVGHVGAATAAPRPVRRRRRRTAAPGRAAGCRRWWSASGRSAGAGWSASSSSVSVARLRSTSSEVGGDLHAVLARPHAGRRVGPAADVDHAHPADADRVHPLVVAQHGDVDAGVPRGRPDRGALGDA